MLYQIGSLNFPKYLKLDNTVSQFFDTQSYTSLRLIS